MQTSVDLICELHSLVEEYFLPSLDQSAQCLSNTMSLVLKCISTAREMSSCDYEKTGIKIIRVALFVMALNGNNPNGPLITERTVSIRVYTHTAIQYSNGCLWINRDSNLQHSHMKMEKKIIIHFFTHY